MKELTKFQVNLTSSIESVLRARELKHTVREVEGAILGDPVLDVNIFVHDLEVDIWIYDDEAQFFVEDGIDERFERPDFDSIKELANEFLVALCRYLDNFSHETTQLF